MLKIERKLINVLSLSTNQVVKKLSPLADVTDKDNYFYFDGAGDILLTCHIDTVNNPDYNPIPALLKDCIINYDSMPLGGDDRNGLLIAGIFHDKINTPFLATNYEETGGHGMFEFISMLRKNKSLFSKFQQYKLILSIDRHGNNHYVEYLPNPEWIEDLTDTVKLEKQYGTWSDCQKLSDCLDIPCINISCGYYNEHTRIETVKPRHVINTIKKIQKIIKVFPAIDTTSKRISLKHNDMYYGYRYHHHKPRAQKDTKRDYFLNSDYDYFSKLKEYKQ